MKKKLSLLLCAAVGLSLVGCAPEETHELIDTTVTVDTAIVERGSLSSAASYIGTISAEGTASVIPMVAGRVEDVYVSVGDTVSAGQVLCRFDDESAQLTLRNARMGLESAQNAVTNAENGVNTAQMAVESVLANYAVDEEGRLTILEEQVGMAEENYANTQALFEAGIASRIELDQAYQTMISAQAGLEAARVSVEQAKSGVESAKMGVQSAKVGVQSAQVGVESAEYQLSLYRLSTPISGVVEAVNVTKNNFAGSGMPAFVISNGNNKTVTFYVTDEVRQTLTVGQSASVGVNGKNYTGAVTEIGGIVDAATGLFQVKAVVDSARDLPDGLVVEVVTKAYEVKNAVLLPSDALYFEDGVAYVYLAREGLAQRAEVSVGLYTRDTIAVTDGLEEGDEVITSWSATLKDGAAIRMAAAPAAE